jgi:choline-glycine betaine transporter
MQIVIWGLILTAVIAALLLAGGLGAIQAAMIVGTVPFTLMMILMGVALLRELIRDEIAAKEKKYLSLDAHQRTP